MRELFWGFLLWMFVASFVFQWRHPEMNAVQFWKHFKEAMCFEVVR